MTRAERDILRTFLPPLLALAVVAAVARPVPMEPPAPAAPVVLIGVPSAP